MAGLKYYERIKLILELIEQRKTGTPGDLARRLQVSERMVYNIMGSLKDVSREKITYSETEKSYIFDKS